MEKFDWNAALGSAVPAEWLLTKGEGVKIAVIDTGVDTSLPRSAPPQAKRTHVLSRLNRLFGKPLARLWQRRCARPVQPAARPARTRYPVCLHSRCPAVVRRCLRAGYCTQRRGVYHKNHQRFRACRTPYCNVFWMP